VIRLVYQLREDVIASFNNLVEVFSKNNNPLLPHVKKELKQIKDPTISPSEIIAIAYRLTRSATSQFTDLVREDGVNIKEKYINVVENFYQTLTMVYNSKLSSPEDFDIEKKYYYFVPDFAKNLKKVKVPNLDKLTLNNVFPGKETIYFELLLKEDIVSIIVNRNEKGLIDGFICLIYPLNIVRRGIDDIKAPFPTYYGHFGEAPDIDQGDTLFKKAWEECVVNADGNVDTTFIASCLLYLQSGDPDIRHMKGENPKKYKINSRDSFFEKRQKQVLSQDAVFNDYELVGWNYKKQYNVAGHWRYQACGPKWSQHKLIFIESFKKGKKSE